MRRDSYLIDLCICEDRNASGTRQVSWGLGNTALRVSAEMTSMIGSATFQFGGYGSWLTLISFLRLKLITVSWLKL